MKMPAHASVVRRRGGLWLALIGSLISAQPSRAAAGEPAVQRVVALTKYPPVAHAAGLQGRIEIVVSINPDGSVKTTSLKSGPGVFAWDARQVLSKWQFSRCESDCGIRETFVTFVFELKGDCHVYECPVDFEVDLSNGVKVTVRSQHQRTPIT
jgi:hypothetical protein